MITKINPTSKIVNKDGRPLRQLQDFLLDVANTSLIIGTGSPEGIIEATQGREYMDDAGTAGAIKYIKKDADVSGDRSLGWILV